MRSLFLLLALSQTALAAPPHQLSFQGYLTDAGGAPLDGSTQLTFALFTTAQNGQAAWTETLAVDIDQGSFSVQLGTQTPITPQMVQGGALFLEITVEDDAPLSPRLEVSSVPYALYSEVADLAVDVAGVIHPTGININGTTIIDASGNWTGSLAGLQGIQGIPGNTGLPGLNGDTCWDLDVSTTCDLLTEDIDGDADCDGDDCRALNCWDTNSNYVCDPGEDVALPAGCGIDDCVAGAVYLPGIGLTLDVSQAFNVTYGTTAGTSAEGNHTHTGTYLPLGSVAACSGGEFMTGVNTSNGNVQCVPASADNDSLAGITCSNGFSLVYGGGSWGCAPSNLGGLNCSNPGEVPVFNGSIWTCVDNDSVDVNGVNVAPTSVDWSRLGGVPGGFSDGVDNDTYAGASCAAGHSLVGTGAGVTCAPDDIGGVNCGNAGEIPVFNGSNWTCVDGDALDGNGVNAAPTALDWSLLGGVPAGFSDGTDNDGYASAACAAGHSVVGTGLSVTCAPDDIGGLNCASAGELPVFNGSNWTCVDGDALDSNGVNAAPTALDWSLLGGVPPGFSDGTDNVGPTYTGSNGVVLSINNFTLDFVSGGSTDKVIRADFLSTADSQPNDAGDPVDWTKLNGVPGGFSDGTDNVGPTYSGSNGVILTINNFTLDFVPGGSTDQVIRADFLSTPDSQPNDAGDPVDWTKLNGVPAGFEDGVDNNMPPPNSIGSTELINQPLSCDKDVNNAMSITEATTGDVDVDITGQYSMTGGGCEVMGGVTGVIVQSFPLDADTWRCHVECPFGQGDCPIVAYAMKCQLP